MNNLRLHDCYSIITRLSFQRIYAYLISIFTWMWFQCNQLHHDIFRHCLRSRSLYFNEIISIRTLERASPFMLLVCADSWNNFNACSISLFKSCFIWKRIQQTGSRICLARVCLCCRLVHALDSWYARPSRAVTCVSSDDVRAHDMLVARSSGSRSEAHHYQLVWKMLPPWWPLKLYRASWIVFATFAPRPALLPPSINRKWVWQKRAHLAMFFASLCNWVFREIISPSSVACWDKHFRGEKLVHLIAVISDWFERILLLLLAGKLSEIERGFMNLHSNWRMTLWWSPLMTDPAWMEESNQFVISPLNRL